MPSDNQTSENKGPRLPVQMEEAEIEEMRKACRALLNDSNLSATQLAQQLGMKPVTFGLWLSGKYTGRNDIQGANVRAGLQLRAERDAVRAIAPEAPGFTNTPSSREFLEIFAHAQHLPDFGVITGAAGIGKTTAACHYTRTTAGVWMIVASPSVIGPRALLDEFARAMDIRDRLAPHNLHHSIVQRLRGTNALLIVDEAQHLQPQALDELRGLHDQAGLGVVLLGNEVVLGKIDGGMRKPEYAQLYSRVGRRLTRKAVRAGDAEALLNASDIDAEDVRNMLTAIARRPGALRGMVKTLRLAQLVAAKANVPLSIRHIEMADKSLGGERRVEAP